MKRLTEMRIFDIIVECSHQETILEEVESAFHEFADYLVILSNAKSEHSVLYRTLTYTRTRLQTLQGKITPNEVGKKCAHCILS